MPTSRRRGCPRPSSDGNARTRSASAISKRRAPGTCVRTQSDDTASQRCETSACARNNSAKPGNARRSRLHPTRVQCSRCKSNALRGAQSPSLHRAVITIRTGRSAPRAVDAATPASAAVKCAGTEFVSGTVGPPKRAPRSDRPARDHVRSRGADALDRGQARVPA